MKQTEALLLGAGVLAIAWIANKASAAANLNFYPGNVTAFNMVGSVPVITVEVSIQNTSSTDVPINSFAGNVFADGSLIGNIANFVPVVIPANSQVVIPVSMQLQILGVVNQIIQAFQYGNVKKALQVNATANVAGLPVPIKLNYNVGG